MKLTAIAVDASGHVAAVQSAAGCTVAGWQRWCDAHAEVGYRVSVVPRPVAVGEQVLDPVVAA